MSTRGKKQIRCQFCGRRWYEHVDDIARVRCRWCRRDQLYIRGGYRPAPGSAAARNQREK